jgi:DMSO/TMAO reductase YedYZ molybdopterin-dependent catalytic subunit
LVDRAGVHGEADQFLSTSVDGFTTSTPIKVALDGRDAMIAVGMNGEPLPTQHGFPARLVVPGLYGYVSACKWITSIKATTYAQKKAYWTQRGWDINGPILTQTRIDVPSSLAAVSPGTVAVAGVCWAQHRGIERVEVSIDGGEWKPAALAATPGIDTWRQWWYRWDAKAGRHQIRARSTDATGAVQTDQRQSPFPRGATGIHEVIVNVS